MREQLRKLFISCCMLFIGASVYAQPTIPLKHGELSATSKKESKDIAYELKHKKERWFKKMNQPGVRYFSIKKSFDRYFGKHRWDESKTRELGEGWIKTKLFYLDKKGRVQAEPPFNASTHQLASPNLPTNGTTYRNMGSWHMLGPVNSGPETYMSVVGNRGGFVILTRIDPTNTQKMFVSFLTAGLGMTTDGGTSWALTDANMPAAAYYDIDVCINNPNIVYAISASRVIKSTDGGLNWTNTSLTTANYPDPSGGYDIAVSSADPNIVIAKWGGKIYRTTDGGTIWNTILTGLPTPDHYSTSDCSASTSEILDWSTTDANVVYFLSANNNQVAVYRSGDSGNSFPKIHTITLDPSANGQSVAWAKLFLPSNNSTAMYIAIGTGTGGWSYGALQWYKLDSTTGVELSKIVNMINGNGPAYTDNLPPNDNIGHGDITMDRANENNIAYAHYSDSKIRYSTNNGATFSLATTLLHMDIRALDMVNGHILVGTDASAMLFPNGGGGLGTVVTNSISNHELWGFGGAFKTDIMASGNNHGPCMVRELVNGFEWYNGPGADQGNTDVNPLDDRYIYSQGYDGYRFFRDGVNHLTNQSNLLDVGGIYSYFNSIEFHPNKYYTIITHHAGQYPSGNPNLDTWKKSLIKTTDNGNTVSIVHTFSDQVFREKICMTNPNYIYVVVGLSNNHLWKTTDGGTSWTDITPAPSASSGQTNISDIAVSDIDPNQVWVTYSGVQNTCQVLKTTQGGTSWTNLTQPILTTWPITKIIFQRGTDGGVYVGSHAGIFYRNNSMANWQQLGNGLPDMDIRFMFINYNVGKLRIGTSRGAWENDLYEVSKPMAQISASTDQVSGANLSVQFKDYSVVRNASATWKWSFPGGTPATSADENPLVSYKNSGCYDVSLSITDAYGSSSQTLSKFIHVSNGPAVVTISSDKNQTSFCQGSSLTLTADASGAYQWYQNGTLIGGATSQTYSVTQPGNYAVHIDNGCGNLAVSTDIKISSKPSPEIPTISVDGAVLTSSATDGNQWYINGTKIPDATSQKYTITDLGTYTVVTTNSSDCSATSDPYSTTNDDFVIYPNPNNGQFQIRKSFGTQILEIKIYNMFGHVIYQSRTGETDINLSGFDAGVYLIEVRTAYKTYKARKFIIEK